MAPSRRLRRVAAATRRGRQFDLIILDPPKFAPTAQHAARAARAYKDINLLALKLLRPDGLLATFSCSGGVSADLFQKIVAGAALDARVDAAVFARMGASADHPVALEFPEGDYLKGLLVQRRND
jgi:23S rRNA (cytosine1962-C5)-methyltransferase